MAAAPSPAGRGRPHRLNWRRPNTALQRSGWIRAILASRRREKHFQSIDVLPSSRPLNAKPLGGQAQNVAPQKVDWASWCMLRRSADSRTRPMPAVLTRMLRRSADSRTRPMPAVLARMPRRSADSDARRMPGVLKIMHAVLRIMPRRSASLRVPSMPGVLARMPGVLARMPRRSADSRTGCMPRVLVCMPGG